MAAGRRGLPDVDGRAEDDGAQVGRADRGAVPRGAGGAALVHQQEALGAGTRAGTPEPGRARGRRRPSPGCCGLHRGEHDAGAGRDRRRRALGAEVRRRRAGAVRAADRVPRPRHRRALGAPVPAARPLWLPRRISLAGGDRRVRRDAAAELRLEPRDRLAARRRPVRPRGWRRPTGGARRDRARRTRFCRTWTGRRGTQTCWKRAGGCGRSTTTPASTSRGRSGSDGRLAGSCRRGICWRAGRAAPASGAAARSGLWRAASSADGAATTGSARGGACCTRTGLGRSALQSGLQRAPISWTFEAAGRPSSSPAEVGAELGRRVGEQRLGGAGGWAR